MPWRKNPLLLREFRKRLEAEKGSDWDADDLFQFMELLLEKVWAAVRWLLVVSAILFVIMIALQWQVGSRNKTLDRVEKVSKHIDEVSARIDKNLSEAVQAGVEPAAESARAIEDIRRICRALQIECL